MQVQGSSFIVICELFSAKTLVSPPRLSSWDAKPDGRPHGSPIDPIDGNSGRPSLARRYSSSEEGQGGQCVAIVRFHGEGCSDICSHGNQRPVGPHGRVVFLLFPA